MNAQADIKQVCKQHGITPYERSEMLFESGCKYADKLAQDWFFAAPSETHSRASLQILNIGGFWNWYKNQWLITDRDILRRFDSAMNALSKYQLVELYKAVHADIKAYPGMEVFKTIYKKQNDTHAIAK